MRRGELSAWDALSTFGAPLPASIDSTTLTANGALLGTPSYMAPERLRPGDPSELPEGDAFIAESMDLPAISDEFAHADLGDVRRTRRLQHIAERADRNPDAGSPQMVGWSHRTASPRGVYRLLAGASAATTRLRWTARIEAPLPHHRGVARVRAGVRPAAGRGHGGGAPSGRVRRRARGARHVFFRQIQILGSTMGPKGDLFGILRHVEQGRLRPVVDRVMPLWSAVEAHRLLERREVFGKIVLTVD